MTSRARASFSGGVMFSGNTAAAGPWRVVPLPGWDDAPAWHARGDMGPHRLGRRRLRLEWRSARQTLLARLPHRWPVQGAEHGLADLGRHPGAPRRSACRRTRERTFPSRCTPAICRHPPAILKPHDFHTLRAQAGQRCRGDCRCHACAHAQLPAGGPKLTQPAPARGSWRGPRLLRPPQPAGIWVS